MRAHSDEDIIRKAAGEEKDESLVRDNKIDIAVDFEDDHGLLHTYVVTFQRQPEVNNVWTFLEINDLSSL